MIHSYDSGWKGADVIPDPPVPGAIAFVLAATDHFRVAIFSSRSNLPGGIAAMQRWMLHYLNLHVEGGTLHDRQEMEDRRSHIEWPREKPPAFLTIDDRAITFTGEWPLFEACLSGFHPTGLDADEKQSQPSN